MFESLTSLTKQINGNVSSKLHNEMNNYAIKTKNVTDTNENFLEIKSKMYNNNQELLFENNRLLNILINHDDFDTVAHQELEYTFLKFDLSGIQKFIFNIFQTDKTQRKILKQIRGRSYFAHMLTRFAMLSLLGKDNLSYENALYFTSGSFMLLYPKNKIKNDDIDKVASILNTFLNFETQVYIATETVSLSEINHQNFPAIFSQLNINLYHNRLKINDMEFYSPIKYNQEQDNYCSMTETLVQPQNIVQVVDIEDPHNICTYSLVAAFCELLGTILPYPDKDNTPISRLKNEYHNNPALQITDDKIILEIDSNYTITYDLKEKCVTYKIADNILHEKIIRNTTDEKNLTKNIGLVVTKNVQNKVESFDEYSDIAIIKLDVDNMGKLFKDISSDSLAKAYLISNKLDYFFTIKLKNILDEYDANNTNEKIYVSYSGGDDVLIITTSNIAHTVLQKIQKAFNRNFAEIARNNNIQETFTFTATILYENPKKAMRLLVQQAEDGLDRGKEKKEKNNCFILNKHISFTEEYDKFCEEIVLMNLLKQDPTNIKTFLNNYYFGLQSLLSVGNDNLQFMRGVATIYDLFKRNERNEGETSVLVDFKRKRKKEFERIITENYQSIAKMNKQLQREYTILQLNLLLSKEKRISK